MNAAPLKYRDEELLADVITRLIGDVRHVAVGNASPIPATAALLARERGKGRPYVSPKVILFRTEHSRRTLVPDVDFISAPGSNEPNVFRTGGPIALVTNRCLFSFADGRFTLTSVHPGHTIEEVIENTGFDFDRPDSVPETPAPSPATLKLMRETVAPQLAEVYPQFAAQVFGIGEKAFGG